MQHSYETLSLISNCTHKFQTATEPKPQSLTILFQHPTNCQQDYRVDGDGLNSCS